MAGRVQSGPLKRAGAGKVVKPSPHHSDKKKTTSTSSAGHPRPSLTSGDSTKHRCPAQSSPSSCSPAFRLSEVQGDLFSCPQTSSLAHCVSEDMAMGKGVAALFKRMFNGVPELKAQGVKTGGVAVLTREDRFVYYLVTKPRYFHKPTYDTLRSSLLAMKEHCQANQVHDLCLPRIGCGLDLLEWDKVYSMIREVFGELDINITVYYL